MPIFHNARILVTGGTGSLGTAIIKKIFTELHGIPESVTVFSRDETKQHEMRKIMTDPRLKFMIGDIRDYFSVQRALQGIDMVFNLAAMKHVPACEYEPMEATRTNVIGVENIIGAIELNKLPVKAIVGISTDKACNPICVMGMTKAIQERILVQANLRIPPCRVVCVRFGNMLESRGSVVPFFREQIANGGPITVTHPHMSRFLITLDRAAESMVEAAKTARPGEIYVPFMTSAFITDLASILCKGKCQIKFIGMRPGERIHEIVISKEESMHTKARNAHYVILPSLAELSSEVGGVIRPWEYMSNGYSSLMSKIELESFLKESKII